MTQTSSRRVASIDAIRALTMMLMLFVNDIPGLKGVPHWLFHAAADEDMLGFSDTIFPAFLFCVGMSVPFAIDNRLRRGASQWSVLSHILWRSFALVVMGLFTLNCEEGAGHIPYLTYSLLMIAGFFLIWTRYEDTPLAHRTAVVTALKAAGALLLLGMVVWCDVQGKPFVTGWWGILGLIGWSYLVTALAYLLCRRTMKWVLVAAVLGIVLCGIIGLADGSYDLFGWLGAMGDGVKGMGELIIVAMLAGGMLELIRENGGIDYIINRLTTHVNGKRGAELAIAGLVSLVNLCTANNTIAILTVGGIAKKIGDRYGVDNKKAASILDTFSCTIQGLIPYGVQMLLAAGLAHLNPMQILPYLYYPMAIGIAATLAILLRYPRRYS